MESSKHTCDDCKREFNSAESMAQHRQSKHTAQPESVKFEGKKGKGRGKIIAAAIVLAVLVGIYFAFASSADKVKPVIGGTGDSTDDFDEKAFAAKIPKESVHWHPHVTIIINGKQTTIPANLGLGGRAHLPVHTHDTDNILHWEVNSPTVDNMQLGFFFSKVWKKEFNKDCILDYCNGAEGIVKMFVNDVENTEFNHYMPKDKDEIKIVFE